MIIQGGNTLLQGFPERLYKELVKLIPKEARVI